MGACGGMATIDRSEADLFMSFVRNRHAMFVRRQAGLPRSAWTDDPILSSGRSFTNVFRLLDRGTQRLVRMLWSDRGRHMDPYETLMLCMVYRRTNRTDFWQQVGQDDMVPNMVDLDEWFMRLYRIAEYNGLNPIDQHPYLLAGSLNPRGRGLSLCEVLALDANVWVDGDAQKNRGVTISDLTGHWDWQHIMDNLCAQPGINDFLAQQITTDFGYSQYGDAEYDNDDVVLGPGSRRGIKRIFPEIPLKDPAAARGAIITLRNEVWSTLPEVNLSAVDPNVAHTPSLMDVQNCLCEFDKYRRISTGGVYRRKWHDHGRLAITLPKNWR